VDIVDTDASRSARPRPGAAEGVTELYEAHGVGLIRLGFVMLGDRGRAEDVVQEVFFYLYKKSELFDGSKGSVKNWILQIAVHRALDKKSHLVRRGFYAGTDIDSLDDTLSGETDLDREIASKLNRGRLEKAFAQLSEIQRKTLGLFYFEGLGLREISERLNEPLGNTRHHFYRGLERLRKSSFVQSLRERKRCQAISTPTKSRENSGRCAPLLSREA